jgi:hypothetical protein
MSSLFEDWIQVYAPERSFFSMDLMWSASSAEVRFSSNKHAGGCAIDQHTLKKVNNTGREHDMKKRDEERETNRDREKERKGEREKERGRDREGKKKSFQWKVRRRQGRS